MLVAPNTYSESLQVFADSDDMCWVLCAILNHIFEIQDFHCLDFLGLDLLTETSMCATLLSKSIETFHTYHATLNLPISIFYVTFIYTHQERRGGKLR